MDGELQRTLPTVGPKLTDRMVEVLQLAAQGHTVDQMCTDLNISKYAVKTHIKEICDRLCAHNLAHAVSRGHQTGWLKADAPTTVDRQAVFSLLAELQREARGLLEQHVDRRLITELKQAMRVIVLDHFNRELAKGAATKSSPSVDASSTDY